MPVIRIGTAAYDVATGHQPPPQLPGITNLDRLADDSILLANGVRIESMLFAPTIQGGALPLGEEAAAGTVLSVEQIVATPEGAFTVQSGAVDLGGGQLEPLSGVGAPAAPEDVVGAEGFGFNLEDALNQFFPGGKSGGFGGLI